MKTLAWLLTAATILIGADVFVTSSAATDTTSTELTATSTTDTSMTIDGDRPVTVQGGNGMPTPPTD